MRKAALAVACFAASALFVLVALAALLGMATAGGVL